MDRPTLERLVAQRRIVSPASVQEPLGLAIELLRSDSIVRALQGTRGKDLELLSAAASWGAEDRDALEKLARSGLVGRESTTNDFVALAEVSETLSSLDSHRRASDGSSAGSDVHETTTTTATADTSKWYGQALTSVRRAAQMLRTIARRPVRIGRKGRPTVIALRELAEAAHCEIETAGRLLNVLRVAGLLVEFTSHDGAEHLGLSSDAPEWLRLDYPNRWLALAVAATASLDDRLRHGLERDASGESGDVSESDEVTAKAGADLGEIVRRLPEEYPLLPDLELEASEGIAAAMEDLGLSVHGHLTPAAQALLVDEVERALEIATHDLPEPVSGVYVQPDLSLIVPGPLLPEDEADLSVITETEQLGPAASLRLSAATLSRAVRRGFTPNAIRELLQRLSLTGIPQPLDYLLSDLERTLGESTLAAQDDHRTSRAMTDAPTSKLPSAQSRAAGPAENEVISAMIERVFHAARDAGTEGDLTRRLKLAIRDRSPVRVTAVSGADEREFLLMPMSLQNGRLRATDQQAGVERTLPVSAIVAVHAA